MYELFPKAKYAVIPNTKCKCRNNPWLAVAQIMKPSAAAALCCPVRCSQLRSRVCSTICGLQCNGQNNQRFNCCTKAEYNCSTICSLQCTIIVKQCTFVHNCAPAEHFPICSTIRGSRPFPIGSRLALWGRSQSPQSSRCQT